MSTPKKAYTPKFKFDRVLETFVSKSSVEIARQYNINSNLISKWKAH